MAKDALTRTAYRSVPGIATPYHAAADETSSPPSATRTQYTDGSTVLVELYMVSGMGHAIAKGTDALGKCPTTSGAYFTDAKVCSTLRTAKFFGLLPSGGGGGSGQWQRKRRGWWWRW